MVHEKTINCAFAIAMAVAGVAGCGGQSSNPPPQSPADQTMTTSAPAMQDNRAGQAAPTDQTPGFSGISGGATPLTDTSASNAGSASPPSTTAGTSLASGNDPHAGAPLAGTGANVGGADGPGLTEGQIVAVLQTADEGEIAQAREATRKAKSSKVKQFAQHMVLDHTAADSKIEAVDHKTGITPATSPMSDQVKANGDQIMTTLKSSSGGADFDKAYIDAQVDEHTKVLDLLDNKLIPRAQNPDLVKTLQEIRSKVAHHLTMAQGIQSSLGQSAQ